MAITQDPHAGINSWLEDELRQQYSHDRASVDQDWKNLFEGRSNGRNGHGTNGNGHAHAPVPAAFAAKPVSDDLAGGEGREGAEELH